MRISSFRIYIKSCLSKLSLGSRWIERNTWESDGRINNISISLRNISTSIIIIILCYINPWCKSGGCRSFEFGTVKRYKISHICISHIFYEFNLLSQEIRCDDLMTRVEWVIDRTLEECEYRGHPDRKNQHTDDKLYECESGCISEYAKHESI